MIISVLGSLCVIIGMYTLLWGKSKETKECLVKQNQEAQEGELFNQGLQVLPVTTNSR